MNKNKNVEFPSFATEEMYMFGVTVTEALILLTFMTVVVLTQKILIPLGAAFLIWRSYKLYKEKGQSNIVIQAAYRLGLFVPKSHIFPEPSTDSFRE